MQIFKITKNFLNKNIYSSKCSSSFYSTSGELTKTITNLKLSYATTYPIQEHGFEVVCSPVSYYVKQKAILTPNKIVYAFPHQGHEVTYSDLDKRVDVAAQNLLELGFKKGDRIAIILPNNLELIITFLASAKIGLISTVLNPAYQAVELEHALKKVGAKGIVIYDSFKTLNHMNLMNKLCPELDSSHPGELNSKLLPDLKHVFVLNSPLLAEKKVYKGTWKFSQLSDSKSKHLAHEIPYVDVEDPFLILFTSGTTGKSKGALMSHFSILNSTYFSTIGVGKPEGLRMVCNPIPMFHVYGLATGIFIPLLFESTKVFPFYFPETLTTIKAIEKYKCVTIRGVPTQYIDILNHPERKKHDLSSLENVVVGASTVPPDLLTKLKDEMNVKNVIVGYGMTETSLCHSMTTYADNKKSFKLAFESVGRPIAFSESKIVDQITGNLLPLNTDGELLIRGVHKFKGYWNDAEKTAETIDEHGWLKTGDIFSMDEQGYLYFKSRNKDMIIRGGANIYPSEIEAFLRTNPSILDAQVFGVPDERMGEEVCAWIRLKEDAKINAEEIRNFCKGNISHFKIPKYIKFVDSYPINSNAKVLKNKMKEMAIAEMN